MQQKLKDTASLINYADFLKLFAQHLQGPAAAHYLLPSKHSLPAHTKASKQSSQLTG